MPCGARDGPPRHGSAEPQKVPGHAGGGVSCPRRPVYGTAHRRANVPPVPRRPRVRDRASGTDRAAVAAIGRGRPRETAPSLTRWTHDRRLRRSPRPPCRPPSAASPAASPRISESATLAVDAKAKALKAAGKPVIGFGAGEPDFPTPDYIVEAAVAAARQPAMHRYTPAGGLPALKEAIVAKTARDSGLQVTAGEGAGHQRRQAGGLRGVRHDARPGRRGAAARAVLDDLPRGDPARRRRAGAGGRRRAERLPGLGRAARGGPHAAHQGAAVLLAVQPDRGGLPGRAGRGDRPLGAGRRTLGAHRRDLRAPDLRRRHGAVDAGRRPGARRPLRRRQRGRQDLRHDRLAGGLDASARPTSSRRRPTCSRTPPPTSPTSPRPPPSRR